MTDLSADHSPAPPVRRLTLIAATGLIALLAVLLCLIPKPENDLFFELRIGSDILRSGHVPHFDTYSWTNRGTRWDVPEWLTFVLLALAFRAGGFFGAWLFLVLLTVATAWTVWFRLVRGAGIAWAFALTTLMLLALKDCLQERPYAFTYLFLAITLTVLTQARQGRWRLLFWLPPLCVLWTNLHQGVLALIGLLLLYTLGDAAVALWLRGNDPDSGWRPHAAWAGRMGGTAAACLGAGMISPYGWRVYWNVFITLRNHNLMANVTEWNPAATLPVNQLEPFILLTALTLGVLALTPRRSVGDCLALAALFGEGLLHARNIPLFAIGSLVIVAPRVVPAGRQMRLALGLAPHPAPRRGLLVGFALLGVAAIALLSFSRLRPEIGPQGYSPEGIGEAVAELPRFPTNACTFLDAEGFPSHLRLLNDFETGGYLMWRLPREPVFVDGRLDVYVGQTFDDMLTLARAGSSPAGVALARRYDFDCVLTTRAKEAGWFAADPQWQLVYTDPPGTSPRCRILLRRRPEFAALIARCLRDTRRQPPR